MSYFMTLPIASLQSTAAATASSGRHHQHYYCEDHHTTAITAVTSNFVIIVVVVIICLCMMCMKRINIGRIINVYPSTLLHASNQEMGQILTKFITFLISCHW